MNSHIYAFLDAQVPATTPLRVECAINSESSCSSALSSLEGSNKTSNSNSSAMSETLGSELVKPVKPMRASKAYQTLEMGTAAALESYNGEKDSSYISSSLPIRSFSAKS